MKSVATVICVHITGKFDNLDQTKLRNYQGYEAQWLSWYSVRLGIEGLLV